MCLNAPADLAEPTSFDGLAGCPSRIRCGLFVIGEIELSRGSFLIAHHGSLQHLRTVGAGFLPKGNNVSATGPLF
jgi:hypothetical protein